MRRRGLAKQQATPLCTFVEVDLLGILEKGRELLTEGVSRDEGGGKLPEYKFISGPTMHDSLHLARKDPY